MSTSYVVLHPWEQRKFSDEIKLVGGGTPFKGNKNYWNGNIVWLSSQELKNKYVSQGTFTITEKAVEDNQTKLISAGTPLIVTRSGILAKRLPLSLPVIDVAINQDIKALVHNTDKLHTDFLVAQIYAKELYILKNIVKTGTTVQSVNTSDLEEMELNMPVIGEQEKIGLLFKLFDDTITLHQRKLEQLNKLKQGFSQKMFPQNNPSMDDLSLANTPMESEKTKSFIQTDSLSAKHPNYATMIIK